MFEYAVRLASLGAVSRAGPHATVTLDDLAWGTAFYAMRTVDVHVARVRAKLAAAECGLRIETVWGTGYRLIVEED